MSLKSKREGGTRDVPYWYRESYVLASVKELKEKLKEKLCLGYSLKTKKCEEGCLICVDIDKIVDGVFGK